MKINIVNYEQGIGINGILTKYAKEMQKALIDLGHQCTVSHISDHNAEVNHHINYESYIPSRTKDTTMITHIDSERKSEIARKSLKTSTGICFSNEMKENLIVKGMPEEKLKVILPAHDSIPRRPRIVAMTYKIYPDKRKREDMFVKMFKTLKEPAKITFRIMGEGWKKTLDPLVKKGIKVQWIDHFMSDFYQELLATSDYLLYTGGENALAQSIIDAKNAGLRIIAPPQENIEVEFPFENQKELDDIFEKICENPVEKWTWENYAKEHLKIWQKK